jgi:hypothetical protein
VSRIRHTLIMGKRNELRIVQAVCDACEHCAAPDHSAKACVDLGRYCRVCGFTGEVRYLCERHIARRFPARREAGHIAEAVYAASGSRIVVYVASEQGIDCGARYAVVCSAHATILGESSLRSARRTMRHPEFCEDCMNASLPSSG